MEQQNNDLSKEAVENQPISTENQSDTGQENTSEPQQNTQKENTEEKNQSVEHEKLGTELNEMKDKYLRLYADFDNFRKRVAKEKLEMSKLANEALIKSLLPTLDNFERAKKSLPQVPEEIKPHIDGFHLIYESLQRTLTGFGLKEIPTAQGDEFNTDIHEAVTQIPMEGLSGKVVDAIEKGYYLEDKVIRFVKVVVGA